MPTYDLSKMDVGLIAQMIAGRYSGFPDCLREAIEEHAIEQTQWEEYSTEDVTLFSKSQGLTQETPLGVLEGVSLPKDGDWGYSRGWDPDDLLVAQAPTQTETVEKSSFAEEQLDPTITRFGYYAVEVKAVSKGDRVRLTENQQEMLQVVSEEVEHVHPVIVMVDVENLPESAEVTVDLYENSVWAEGQMSKTV
jgi:hypothetical protein